MENKVRVRTKVSIFFAGAVAAAVFLVPVIWHVLQEKENKRSTDQIIVLYTNDIHCSIEADENTFGFDNLAGLKDWAESISGYVTLVDCGDAIQGEAVGTLSKGESMVELMNEAGYDICTFGNHEFDYGIEQALKVARELSHAEYTSCNFVELKTGDPVAKPYVMMDYDGILVAYVGISTPQTVTKSTPKYFMDESGQYVYGFCQGEGGAELYDAVQSAVDEAKSEGADYVIAAAHLGTGNEAAPYRSTDVIANTSGIDVVLDGHSHSVIQGDLIQNKDGEEVLLTSTGSKLTNVGFLTIDTKGTAALEDDTITARLLSNQAYRKMGESIGEIRSEYEELLDTVVARLDVELSTSNDKGSRIVRCRETNLGDFCADAYRIVSGADLAVVNGGGIRANLSPGKITYRDILNVYPYGNRLCVVECSGQEILDMLEMAYKNVEEAEQDAFGPLGESGGFLQVSGIKLTIDTGIESSVVLDENGVFASVSGSRRVKDVQVLNGQTKEYEDVEPGKTYTLAANNYMLHNGGDGFGMFMDNTYVLDEFMLDHQVLITYLTDCLGTTAGREYEKAQERITVR